MTFCMKKRVHQRLFFCAKNSVRIIHDKLKFKEERHMNNIKYVNFDTLISILGDAIPGNAAIDTTGEAVEKEKLSIQGLIESIALGEEKFSRLKVRNLQFTPNGEEITLLGSVTVPFDNGKGTLLLENLRAKFVGVHLR